MRAHALMFSLHTDICVPYLRDFGSEEQKRMAAECLQLHGGYGFMMEYPIATDYADAAVQSIYAGSNEIMKVIIARRLGLGD